MGEELNRDAGLSGVRAKWRPSLAMVIGAVLAIVLTLPLAGMAAVVVLSRSPETLLQSLADNSDRILAAGFVIVAVTGVVGFLFWRLVTRPIKNLVRWAEAVASRSRSPALPGAHYGTRELARLATSFFQMVVRLQERSDYISTFTAHVSHELKSPLTSIAGAAELMRDAGDQMDPDTRARFLTNIERDAVRLSTLVARMRDLARAENARSGGASHLPDIAARLRERFPTMTISVDGAASVLPMPIEDALVVFSHLADNALAHRAGELNIRTYADSRRIIVEITNNGEPISASNRTKVFEPFYTTRRESGGTGMGLTIIQAMLKAHGGGIALSDAEVSTVFRIVLPA